MTIDDTLRALRQAFFAYRNGVVAEALRRGGDPHALIMGCQLADLLQITRPITPDAALAEALWADRSHRECRLAATMLYPAGEMTADAALRWATDVQCIEEADVLCHRLLRHTTGADALWRELIASPQTLQQYAALRLLLNLLLNGREADHQAVTQTLRTAHLHPTPSITALLRDIEEDIDPN